MRGAELAGDQRGVWQNPSPEREIDTVLDQIELVVGQAQFDSGFRKKIEHRAGQEIGAEADRSRNANCARRLRSRFREPEIRIFDCPQCLAALLVIETSCVRSVLPVSSSSTCRKPRSRPAAAGDPEVASLSPIRSARPPVSPSPARRICPGALSRLGLDLPPKAHLGRPLLRLNAAAFTISAHFRISETTNAFSSSGVLDSSSMPAARSFSCVALSERASGMPRAASRRSASASSPAQTLRTTRRDRSPARPPRSSSGAQARACAARSRPQGLHRAGLDLRQSAQDVGKHQRDLPAENVSDRMRVLR